MHAWEQIQNTVDYIEQHLGEPIMIDELAQLAALSPFYYQRLFHRLVKKPVAEYIKLRRMAKALDALMQGNRRILDIALELGFASHEHFARTFKQTFGVAPSEYRKNPQAMNRMTKPQLLFHYALIDEGVPLITDGMVLEISRRELSQPISFVGLEKKMPVHFVDGLGTESGVDPLYELWEGIHAQEDSFPGRAEDGQQIGVSYPCEEAESFLYFAGIKSDSGIAPEGWKHWDLPQGKYVVCTFEAENFNGLVMDALYKAQQYLFGTWLPNHQMQTELFCAERYDTHTAQTTSMEIWLKEN